MDFLWKGKMGVGGGGTVMFTYRNASKKKTELKSLFQLYFNQLLWFWSHDPAVNSVDELLHADLCGRNFTFDGVLLLSSKTTTPMLLVTSINPHIKTITPSDDVRDTQRHTQLALGS